MPVISPGSVRRFLSAAYQPGFQLSRGPRVGAGSRSRLRAASSRSAQTRWWRR